MDQSSNCPEYIVSGRRKAIEELVRGRDSGGGVSDSSEVSFPACGKSEHAGDGSQCTSAPVFKDPRGCYKRRKTIPLWTINTPNWVDDGYAWTKYGEKVIRNGKHPRIYFRCTHKYDQHCKAKKRVQKLDEEPTVYQTTYHDQHTCYNSLKASQLVLDPTDNTSSYELSSFFNKNPFCRSSLVPSIKQEYNNCTIKEIVPINALTHHQSWPCSDHNSYFLSSDHDTYDQVGLDGFSSSCITSTHSLNFDHMDEINIGPVDFDDEDALQNCFRCTGGDDQHCQAKKQVQQLDEKSTCDQNNDHHPFFRKTTHSWTTDTPNLADDGHAWRKYGQKVILNAKHPRNYFRCTDKYDQHCQATKQVQQLDEEPTVYRTTYYGHHTCNNTLKASQLILDPTDNTDSSKLLSFNNNVHGSSFDFLPSEGKRDGGDLKLLETHYSPGCSILQLPWQLSENVSVVDPSRPLSLGFCAETLVEIIFSYKNDKQLWPGRQPFVNLKVLDLNNSNLTRLPDLSEATKLRRLNLQGCKSLAEVSSIQHLTKIEHLNLKGCTFLRSLPSFIGLKFLSALGLSDCSNLSRLPPSLGCLSCLAILDVRNCKRLHHIPISILRLKSLHSLDISGCLNLVKHMTGNEKGEVRSFAAHSSLSHRDNFVHGSFTHGDISIKFNEQQQEYSSTAMVSNSASKTEKIGALPQVDVPLLDQPVFQYSLKRSFNLLKEERSGNTVDFREEALLERRTSSEIKSQNSQHSSMTESESSIKPTSTSLSFLQVRKALESYMNMSLEDIHQADAFDGIESFVNSLIRQSPNLQDRAALEDLLRCVEEYKANVPETMICMKATRTRKTSLQVKLTHVGASLVQAAEQYNSLQDKLTMLSQEEEELEDEIERLLAKNKELLDQHNSLASH